MEASKYNGGSDGTITYCPTFPFSTVAAIQQRMLTHFMCASGQYIVWPKIGHSIALQPVIRSSFAFSRVHLWKLMVSIMSNLIISLLKLTRNAGKIGLPVTIIFYPIRPSSSTVAWNDVVSCIPCPVIFLLHGKLVCTLLCLCGIGDTYKRRRKNTASEVPVT